MSFNTRETRRSRVDFSESPSMTEQSHSRGCDIHNIMSKYEKTGGIDHEKQYQGQYLDLPSSPDFHAAMNTIAQANSMFESVPSDIRKKFHNDPAQYIAFMQNAENYEKIVEMGLDASHLPEPKKEPAEGDGVTSSAPEEGNGEPSK